MAEGLKACWPTARHDEILRSENLLCSQPPSVIPPTSSAFISPADLRPSLLFSIRQLWECGMQCDATLASRAQRNPRQCARPRVPSECIRSDYYDRNRNLANYL